MVLLGPPNQALSQFNITFAMHSQCFPLQVTPYAQDEMVLIVPRNHVLARRDFIDKSELHTLSFVSLNKSSTVQVNYPRLMPSVDHNCVP